MDPSNVSLVSMHLNKNFFDHFECKTTTTLGVNLESIQKILKCGNTDDVLVLKTNDDNTELKFQFEKEGRCIDLSLQLMNVNDKHYTIPERKPDASITMTSTEFQKICLDLEQFGDVVTISVRKDKVVFAVNGLSIKGSVAHTSSDSKSDSKVEIKCDSNDPFEISFDLSFLNIINKAQILSEKVTLTLFKNFPLSIKFELDDDAGFIEYHLAPLIENEDDKSGTEKSFLRKLFDNFFKKVTA